MANPSKSFSCRVNWTGLIPILGMGTIRSTALPQSFTCPICKTSHLQIFDDHVLGGQWAACRACRFAGDLIELAAATWRVEVPAAVLRLGGLDQLSPIPSDEDTESYLRDHIQYRRRLEEFWGRAQKEAGQVANPSIRDLLRSFCLFDLAQSPEWLRRTGRFVGAATAKEVEEILFLYSYQVQPRLNSDGNSTKRRGGGPGGRRIFSGHDWHDLLVVPFYDLPGRICAFLFIGRDGNPIKDFVFKRVNLGRTNLPIREAGVAMLDALGDRQPHDLGNSIFVINDPMIGLILQARHMRSSVFPLPIVLGHYSQDVRSLHALDQYADRKIICWGNGDDALLQAKHLDGLVSSYRINPTEVSEHKLDHDPPHWWLYKIAKRARPWTEALRDELRRRDPLDAEALLRRIALSSSEMELFMRGSSPAEQEWLVRCNPHRVFLRRVVVGGKAILEKNSGWILERSGESICNAPVRLEQLLITTTGEEFYRGFAGPNSKRVRFTISVRDVRRHGLFQCVRDAVMKPGIPMFIYNPCWEKRAEFIATQFQPPEVVPCADRIGWSQDQLSFLFPTFAIRLGGEVQQDSLLLVHHDDVPARHLTSPTSGGPFPSQVAALSAKTNETAILWAMAACVVHNIIAPAMNCEPCGIILDGEGAHQTGRLAALALGCAEVDLSRRQRYMKTILERIHDGCCQHGWPTIVRFAERNLVRITSEWVEDAGCRNAILLLDQFAAPALASYRGYFRIRWDDPGLPLGELQRAAATIIPSYLQDAARRKLWIDRVAEHGVFDVLEDMAAWFQQQDGDAAVVRSARRVLAVDSLTPGKCLVEVADRLFLDGGLDVTRVGFDAPKRKRHAIVNHPAGDTTPAAVWVPAKDINKLLAEHLAPILDLAAVERSLREVGVLLEVASYRGREGWFVDAEWWNKQLNGDPQDRLVTRTRRRTKPEDPGNRFDLPIQEELVLPAAIEVPCENGQDPR